jgi:hypothetical protein
MGLTVRHFWLHPDGTVRPISWRKFRPIWDGEVAIPGAENAEAVLECVGGKPLRLIRVSGNLLRLDPTGRVPEEDRTEHLRLAVTSALLGPAPPSGVRSITEKRAAQRLKKEYYFDLTPKEVDGVCRVIWRKGRRPSR